jgi:hypothetical protein
VFSAELSSVLTVQAPIMANPAAATKMGVGFIE